MKINLLCGNTDWKKDLLPGFSTERLNVRILSEHDLSPLLAVSRDKEIFTYLNAIKRPKELEDWLRSVYQKSNYLFYSIKGNRYSECSGSLIGVVMLNRIKNNRVELGGWLGKDFHNMGFGSETVRGLLRYLQQKKPELQLVARTRRDNYAAMSVLDIKGIERKADRCQNGN